MKSFLLLFLPFALFSQTLPQEQLQKIGLQVWQNECRSTFEGLIFWNAREPFPSLGIGHFIWHPANSPKKFEETFPKLLAFIAEKWKAEDKKIPSWIMASKGCPWKNREEFVKEIRSKKVNELRRFLSETIDLQTLFLLTRFEQAEGEIIPLLTPLQKNHLQSLKNSPQGIYALIDYVNFKGIGTSSKEQYRGEGWGLLQVLQNMKESDTSIVEFANSAKKVLERRIYNSPPSSQEEKWRDGWNKRVETYLHF